MHFPLPKVHEDAEMSVPRGMLRNIVRSSTNHLFSLGPFRHFQEPRTRQEDINPFRPRRYTSQCLAPP